MRLRLHILAALTLALAGLAPAVHAQDKPPLRILVGFPPGGSADTLARLVADALRDDFSPVTVENKPGAVQRLRRDAGGRIHGEPRRGFHVHPGLLQRRQAAALRCRPRRPPRPMGRP